MKKMNSILVTGASGQLGREFKRLSVEYPQFDFHFYSREQLPVEDEFLISAVLESSQASLVINCAAYTAVDKAESEKEEAYKVNALGPALLSKACHSRDIRLVHISTDYVFDGRSSVPYNEGDDTNPQSVYGKTKLEGEKLVLANHPSSVIIRTSWVYSEFGNNFVKTMIRLMNERPEVNVVNDQFGSPTYAADLANVILQIAGSVWRPGIYHFSNDGIITWYDLAMEIRKMIASSCVINPIPTTSYPTPAKRPHYSGLDKSRIIEAYGIELRDWRLSLAECLGRMTKNQGA